MPREMTTDEVRNEFLDHIADLVTYRSGESIGKDTRGRLEGLAFSILAVIDGSAVGIPSFILAPIPHEDDKSYHQEHGGSWYPENHQVKGLKADIAGGLHELIHGNMRARDER